jgi:hypothetical protein
MDGGKKKKEEILIESTSLIPSSSARFLSLIIKILANYKPTKWYQSAVVQQQAGRDN